VTFTAFFGFLICLALGIESSPALYIGVALTFSSTIIIVKLLSDKREITALHGKIALGFLIVQDIVVVLAMVTLSALGVGIGGEGGALLDVAFVFLGGLAAPRLRARLRDLGGDAAPGHIARSPELLVIFAVAWAAAASRRRRFLGFGKELGGLLAGVSLASTPFRDAIGSRLSSLRDFLLLFFFLALGMGLNLSVLGEQMAPALVLSLFVLIGNPLIVMAIMGYMGYRKRTGFLAGLTVAQISEFSLIFMAMGMTLGHVGEGAMGLVTLVGLVTIALSVYMITYSHKLYEWLEPLMGPFERRHAFREEDLDEAAGTRDYDFIIFGLGRYGFEIGEKLIGRGYKVLGVDFDPEALRLWHARGHPGVFGDATDPEFAGHLPLNQAHAVISAVPRVAGPLTDADAQLALLHGLRSAKYGGEVVLAMDSDRYGDELRQRGATVLLQPFHDAADYAVARIEEALAAQAARTGTKG
jgi:predicted Kef-type K+ transport protein